MRDDTSIRFAGIAGCVILFVVLYVWQNISMMKIKMECRNGSLKEMELMKKNDRILYEIERYRRIDIVENRAIQAGMRRISPANMQTVLVGGNK
ncbi:MAG: hypothetical protein KBA61_13000 [Spirochaetes bacterium]|nr:hypothetical protein [Spirochaetota bacterium]